MDKKLIIFTFIIVIAIFLLACNIFFAFKYLSVSQQLREMMFYGKANEKIKNVQAVFVDKVLEAQGPVSYEDRLDLENAVVDTNNNEIIKKWQDLLESKTEEEARRGVIDLLHLFAASVNGIK